MATASGARFYFISVIGERVLTDLRRSVFDHLLTLDATFFDTHRVGELTSRLNGDVATIRGAIGSSLSMALRGLVTIAGAVTMMFLTSPYLALAVMAAAGIDGLERRLEPPPPINRNIYEMSVRDRRKHKIKDLPANLREAIGNLRRDKVIIDALGDHVYRGLVDAKTQEYDEYRVAVHQWELDRYLAEY